MTTVAARKKDHQRFVDYLRGHSYKLTPERLSVMDEVLTATAHFTVDDLYDQLRRKGDRRVSRATIYRTIELMVESGLVNKIDWIEATTHFELAHDDEHHDHFICSYCGQIYEFYSPKLEQVQEEVCRVLGLVADDHTLKVAGIPQHCREQVAATGNRTVVERGHCPFAFRFRPELAERV
ncbi:MAG: transcriptional repressor [bacterium]